MLHCTTYNPNLKDGPWWNGPYTSTEQLPALYLTADHDNFVCAWQLDTFQWNYSLEMHYTIVTYLEGREPREKALINGEWVGKTVTVED